MSSSADDAASVVTDIPMSSRRKERLREECRAAADTIMQGHWGEVVRAECWFACARKRGVAHGQTYSSLIGTVPLRDGRTFAFRTDAGRVPSPLELKEMDPGSVTLYQDSRVRSGYMLL